MLASILSFTLRTMRTSNETRMANTTRKVTRTATLPVALDVSVLAVLVLSFVELVKSLVVILGNIIVIVHNSLCFLSALTECEKRYLRFGKLRIFSLSKPTPSASLCPKRFNLTFPDTAAAASGNI